MYIDTTNNALYYYTNGAWYTASLAVQNKPAGTTYSLVLGDIGKSIYVTTASFTTVTVPAASSVAFPLGTTITIINQSGGNITIPITSDTMYLAGAGTTGTRTLSNFGVATLIKVSGLSSAGVWFISGSGLT